MTVHLKTESHRARKLRRHQMNSATSAAPKTPASTPKFTGPEKGNLTLLQRLKARFGI